MQRRPIYLDYAATTPVDPRVRDAMIPWLTERFGNPASRTHAYGWEAEKAVEEARSRVAELVGCEPRELVWTSGATEADNLAIKGVAEFYRDQGRHLITLQTEHKAVLDSVKALEARGFTATYLPVQENGLVDVDELERALRPDTLLVSVALVNSEIGVIQPIEEIGALCRERGILFHVDAAQATGKVTIDLQKLDVSLMSFSAHKTYGPKGIGALYVRRRPRVRLEAQMHGGGHERGFRSGTLPTHQIVGMGEAYRLARAEMSDELPRIRALRDRLLAALQELPGIHLNGDLEHRVPHNLNVSVESIEGDALLLSLGEELAVSAGSACTSASLEPSYVLRALGRSPELARSALRLTLGRFTTAEEIDTAIRLLRERILALRGR
ncbi:Cysteine sulfinate desulfinase/cysteine desulfurase or related enzyme [Tepidiphilus thermophilus]|uniref:Cysteine desulfurase IscS n=1 Tax=Tepidiphilus thermophilus TaxID=876478 RepID=A0A0K6IR10_9PROT|nr:IscS subfamily cysteine desulfurase [Tepidiphilus thermophilus]CUB05533.1 Cysteine sulfinate desulfinase/cysteine desulfurase or related enzyme [Tepidiphilus thermophilus]